MKSRAEQLDEMSKAILIATDRIRYANSRPDV